MNGPVIELVIGLSVLAVCAAVFAAGMRQAHRRKQRWPDLERDLDPVALEPNTEVIPRGSVHRALSQGAPVSGVEPQLERAESWPVRHRNR